MGKLRIAFSGIGAVGGYYGGMLTARYQREETLEIFFIARGENLNAINKYGLRIKTKEQTISAYPTLATDNPVEIGAPVDYLFCCTKAYDLEENLVQLAPIIGPDTVIIPLLNGMDIAERIQKRLPGQTVWKGCVYIGARLISPGVIHLFSNKERLFFGNSQTNDKLQQAHIQRILANSNINAFNPPDIDTRIWKKFFMISTAATITSYLNLPIMKVIEQHKDLFIALCSELKSLTDALGIPLDEDIIYTSIDAQKMMPPGATTSMHTDFLHGKRTELETLTGSVVRLADSLGLNIPTYQLMYKSLAEFPYPIQTED